MFNFNKKKLKPGHMLLLVLAVIIPTTIQSNHARAEQTLGPQNTARTITHTIQSQFPEQQRHISVHLPKGYADNADTRYPVLYILDAETNMDFTIAVVDFLSEGGQIPAMIIVGIHADGTRDVDYLPKLTDPESLKTGLSGEANHFLTSIENEVIPLVQKTYRTTDFRLISGHSYGGLFVTYALTQNPKLFAGYFAQSPYFMEAITRFSLTRLDVMLQNNPDMQGAYFMTLGNEPLLAKGFAQVGNLLKDKAPKSMLYASTHQSGRDHMQTRMIGIYEALEQYFAKDWPIIAAIESGNITAHFDGLASKYGTRPRYELNAFVQAIQGLLQTGKVGPGTELSQEFVNQHPDSPFSHFLLFNAYAMGGNRDNALREVNAAIKIIDETPEPSMEMKQLYPQLKQVQKQLGGE